MDQTLAIAKPDYGNWVSNRLIILPAGLTVLFGGLAFLLPILIVPAVFFASCFAYFAYARYRLSPAGGDVQARVQVLVLDRLEWDGKGAVIDIGCGNAPLAIAIAQKYPQAEITATDFWGGSWEYAKSVCERNAAIAGVAGQVTFEKTSAASLPYADGTFDAAVSNLVFHEVSDARDKREVIREALRVVRKGGVFVFQDLFLLKRVYGDVDDLVKTIQGWGVEQVAFVDTSRSDFIPAGLKLPFMVGTIGILYGKK